MEYFIFVFICFSFEGVCYVIVVLSMKSDILQ